MTITTQHNRQSLEQLVEAILVDNHASALSEINGVMVDKAKEIVEQRKNELRVNMFKPSGDVRNDLIVVSEDVMRNVLETHLITIMEEDAGEIVVDHDTMQIYSIDENGTAYDETTMYESEDDKLDLYNIFVNEIVESAGNASIFNKPPVSTKNTADYIAYNALVEKFNESKADDYVTFVAGFEDQDVIPAILEAIDEERNELHRKNVVTEEHDAALIGLTAALGRAVMEDNNAILESRMSELHATCGQHMDKHIGEYKKNGGAEALMSKARTAAARVATAHKIKQHHAQKFVNDYIDSKLREDTTSGVSVEIKPHKVGEKKIATPGKHGYGPSAARHLARMGIEAMMKKMEQEKKAGVK